MANIHPFLRRIIRAVNLEPRFYKEILADRNCLGQAAGVVFLSALAAASSIGANTGWFGFVGTLFCYPVGWLVWALASYLAGAERGGLITPAVMLRMIGFAYAPGIICFLGVNPLGILIVFLVAWIWIFAAAVVAVRQAFDIRNRGRAVIVCAAGWILQIMVWVVLLRVLAAYVEKTA